MGEFGWTEVRRRSVVIAGAAALATAGLVVTDRWPDGSDGSDGDAAEGGRLSLGGQGRGLSTVDVALDDSYDVDAGKAGRARAGARRDYRTRTIEAAPFTMVGLTWRGPERPVRIGTRSGGRWSAWRTVQPTHDGPDAGVEGTATKGIDLQWVGESDAIRVEVLGGRPRDLQLTLMRGDRSADRVVPGGVAGRRAPRPANTQRIPKLHSRGEWSADPSLRSGTPTYNRSIYQMHVHHTVNSNDYAPKDVPGLLRGMYRYHTQNLGWSDIGYNFLVDRFGRIWVGRAGGAGKPVRGAHTLGFNDTSFGVAVIGNFEAGKPGGRIVTALVHIGAWKLQKYGRNPAGNTTLTSTGSDRFRSGRRVTLPVIDGHRDTNETACPGKFLYATLPDVRRRAAARAKLWS